MARRSLALPDVRDALARIKMLLAPPAASRSPCIPSEDQLTLNPHLELFIYARTDRWLYLLQGKGLEEQRLVRTKSWKLIAARFPPAPELERRRRRTRRNRSGLTPA